MFSPGEIMTLTTQAAALPLVIALLRSSGLPGRRLFLAAYVCLLLSNTFTVVEGVCWPVLCDSLEHLSMALFAVLMLRAVQVFLRDQPAGEP